MTSFCDDANVNSIQSYKTAYRTLNYMRTHRLRSLSLRPIRNDSVASDINIYGPQYRTFTGLQDSSGLASEQYYDSSRIWPEHGSHARKKDNILRKLCRIHAIPPGGSVLSNMDSVTRSVKSQRPLQKPGVARTNCRLVLSDITHDLSTYQTSYQLVALLLSALNGAFLHEFASIEFSFFSTFSTPTSLDSGRHQTRRCEWPQYHDCI